MSNKSYSMEDLGIAFLIGKKIKLAEINEEKDLVVLTTQEDKKIYLTWEGDCCASCYIQHVSGVDNLIGAEILSAENAEWKDISSGEEYEVTESMGTNIKTTKGYVTFESRVEHNGYYGGYIYVSDDEPMDQYSSPRYDGKLPELKKLVEYEESKK